MREREQGGRDGTYGQQTPCIRGEPSRSDPRGPTYVSDGEGRDGRTLGGKGYVDAGLPIKVLKRRRTRDDKHRILEFKLTGLSVMEEEIVRVLTHGGGIIKHGPAPRGERVRDLEDKLGLQHGDSQGGHCGRQPAAHCFR